MPEPRSLKEWLEWCQNQYAEVGPVKRRQNVQGGGLCLDCARAYTEQEKSRLRAEMRLEDEGITCPRCDGPCRLDSTDEIGQEYLCLTCGARVRVRWKEVRDA